MATLLALAAACMRGAPRALGQRQRAPLGVRAVAAHAPCVEALPPAAKLCLVDGHALAYRMHFALQKSAMSTVSGQPTHALHGFCTKLLDLNTRFPDHRMLVAFDLPEQTFREAAYPSYKAQRPPMPMPLRPQIEAMKEVCALLDAPPLSAPGFEADDVIATCVAAAREHGASDVVIVSPDKDLLQLVASSAHAPTRVTVWNDMKKLSFDDAAVHAKHGVPPCRMADLLALMGDASDNVPGVPGVGAKIAAKLLAEHGDLHGVLHAATSTMRPSKRRSALVEHAESVVRARELVQLSVDAPLDRSLLCGGPLRFDHAQLPAFLQSWELLRVGRAVAKLQHTAKATAKQAQSVPQ